MMVANREDLNRILGILAHRRSIHEASENGPSDAQPENLQLGREKAETHINTNHVGNICQELRVAVIVKCS